MTACESFLTWYRGTSPAEPDARRVWEQAVREPAPPELLSRALVKAWWSELSFHQRMALTKVPPWLS